jgi:2-oxoglutarate ferredoxin oxidoreductase subunit alpha
MNARCQEQLIPRLTEKISRNAEKIAWYYEDEIEGADVVVVTYGISSRVSMRAIRKAREKGTKVGHLRLVTVWPFPEKYIRRLAGRIDAFVVPELNLGQVVLEVERCAGGKCNTVSVPHAGGAVHDPEVIYDAIVEAVR